MFARLCQFACCLFFAASGPAAAQASFTPVQLKQLLVLAQQGNAQAQYHVGMFYNNGLGGAPVEPKAAFAWFKKAAAGNDPLGAYKAGCYYAGQFHGVVTRDAQRAFEYKMVAAQAGYALAQVDVAGALHARGDRDGASAWLQKAAAQGEPLAMVALWWSHSNGKTMSPDPLKAYRYLTLFARFDTKANRTALQADIDQLAAAIGPDERASIDEEVRAWTAQPSPLTLQAKGMHLAVARLLGHQDG